jgi:uncharacterized membrane protein
MLKIFLQFLLGGFGYYTIESIYRALLHRGRPHWTMFILGGLSLVWILFVDKKIKCSIVIKSILSGVVITSMEFILGYYYTYILHTPIWTYGTADFMGVISFTWSLLWCGLALIVLIIKRLFIKYNTK